MAVRWRSGALGTMSVTMLTYPKNLEGSITVLGEGHGEARRPGGKRDPALGIRRQAPGRREGEGSELSTTSVYGFGHPLYYDNVIKTLRGEAEAETDGREGLKTPEILIATYLAARDGRRVTLPLDY